MATKNPNDSIISNWLKKELKRTGMTPADLAEKITQTGTRVSRAVMYYYVSGERLPSHGIARLIASALGSQAPEYAQRRVGRPKKEHIDVRKLV